MVLVYNLLLEMLDANTSSSPGSDSNSDQFQYPEPPAPPDPERTFAGHAPAPPGEAPPLRSSPPFQSLLVAHMDDE